MKQHNLSHPLWTVLSAFISLMLGQLVAANEPIGKPILVDTSRSAEARLRPVPLDAVRWTRGFWAERYEQSRDVTLRKLSDLAADPEAGHVLDNMRIAGGLEQGEFAGTDWQDAWLYKWIESAAAFYAITRDPWIEERMDTAIDCPAQPAELKRWKRKYEVRRVRGSSSLRRGPSSTASSCLPNGHLGHADRFHHSHHM